MTQSSRSTIFLIKLFYCCLLASTLLVAASGLWVLWSTFGDSKNSWYVLLFQSSLLMALVFLVLLSTARGLLNLETENQSQ